MIQDIAPHRLDNHFVPGWEPCDDSPVFCFKEDKVLIAKPTDEEKRIATEQEKAFREAEEANQKLDLAKIAENGVIPLRLPRKRDFPKECTFTFLFQVDDVDYYLAQPDEAHRNLTAGVMTEEDIYADDSAKADSGIRVYREKPEETTYSGFDDEGSVFIDGFSYVRLHGLRAERIGGKYQYFAAVTAYQLSRWYASNRFCGRCGAKTVQGTKERVLICPACGNHIYPKIVPAVIVGVTNGDKLLMTKYAGRGIGYYALVAGFTEIGETLEETVAREVMEETGLKVKNIRYYKSQPWGIVDDILAGFYCDVDGSDRITMDASELKVAEWVDRKDITGQPDNLSLTNEMMLVFRDGKEPKMHA